MKFQLLALAAPAAAASLSVQQQSSNTLYAQLTPIAGASIENVNGFVSLAVSSKGIVSGKGNAINLERMLNIGSGDCTAANGCGAHIHAGSGCADTEAQGGHLFSSAEDPWGSAVYATTDALGNGNFEFDVEIDRTDIEGRAFVLHANDGSRIACGVLRTGAMKTKAVISKTMTAQLAPIAGASTANVTGFVSLTVTDGGAVRGAGKAANLERMLDIGAGDCTAANGCGAHIHAGSGCEDTEAQGGHLFSSAEDPWGPAVYQTTDEEGNGFFELDVEIDRTDIEGRAFVLHANDGSRIACGILA